MMVLGYAFPYVLSFSNGTYHFPVMFLLMPIAALGMRMLISSQGRQSLKQSFAFWIGAIVLLSIQFEYAYFTFLYAPATATMM